MYSDRAAGDDAALLMNPSLRRANLNFWKLPTVWITFFEILILVLYAVFALIDIPNSFFTNDKYYQVRIVMAVVTFVLFGVISRVIHWYHSSKAPGGISTFASNFSVFITLPWVVCSVGNTAILLLELWPEGTKMYVYERLDALKIIITLQAAAGILCAVYYLHVVRKFFIASLATGDELGSAATGVLQMEDMRGAQERERDQKEILTRQNEMIRNLKEQRAEQAKEIAELTERLSKPSSQREEESSDAYSPLEQENVRLKAELDTMRLQQRQLDESLTKPVSQQVEAELRRCRNEITQLHEQLTKLQLKYDIEREASAEAQAMIDKLNTDLSTLRSKSINYK